MKTDTKKTNPEIADRPQILDEFGTQHTLVSLQRMDKENMFQQKQAMDDF